MSRTMPPRTLELQLDEALAKEDFADDCSTTRTFPPDPPRAPSGNSYLVLLFGGNVGQVFTIKGEQVTVGRDSSCSIQLPDRSVSRHHVTISCREGRCVLKDSSRNGTFVNDKRVAGPRPLQNDDRIRIGKHTVLKFVDGADPEADYVLTMYDAAMTDPLTGVFNRRYLQEQLQREVSFARRHGAPLSVAMLDLDRFKDVNDVLGHLAGDQVLKEFAELVRRSIRTEDTMGRYGGEEFLVICRCDLRSAAAEAERLRAITEEHLFCAGTDQVRRTVSIGVAEFDPEQPTIEDLLARADQAMYQAKGLGRNRVCDTSDG